MGVWYQVERRAVGQVQLGLPQRHGEGDQALLDAVVQVALDAAPLGLEGVDQSGPRPAQVGHGRGQLRLAGVEQQPGQGRLAAASQRDAA